MIFKTSFAVFFACAQLLGGLSVRAQADERPRAAAKVTLEWCAAAPEKDGNDGLIYGAMSDIYCSMVFYGPDGREASPFERCPVVLRTRSVGLTALFAENLSIGFSVRNTDGKTAGSVLGAYYGLKFGIAPFFNLTAAAAMNASQVVLGELDTGAGMGADLSVPRITISKEPDRLGRFPGCDWNRPIHAAAKPAPAESDAATAKNEFNADGSIPKKFTVEKLPAEAGAINL